MPDNSTLKNKIAWLASYPKSGNTWVRVFLHAYLFDYIDINNLFATTGDIDQRNYNHLSALPITDMEPGELVFLRHASLVGSIQRSQFHPVVMKTHNANIIIGDVMLIPSFLTRNAIYLIRDPRDVVCSFSRHIGQPITDTIYIMHNQKNILYNPGRPPHYTADWSLNVTTWVDQDDFPVLKIKYEDMLADPVESFSKIVASLGQAVNHTKVKKAVESVEIDKLKRLEKKKGFIEASKENESFFNRGKAGYWKDQLSEGEVRLIEQQHGEVMERFGYKLEYL